MTVYSTVYDANGYIIPNRIDSNFNIVAATNVTISSGTMTVTNTTHKVIGEGATTDTLHTITGGKVGQQLILMPNSTGYTITIAKISGSTGNIDMPADTYLASSYSNLVLLCTSTGTSGTAAWIKLAATT